MKTYDISQEARAIVDLRNGQFKAFSAASKETMNESIRAMFTEIMPTPNANGRYNHRQLEAALPKVYAILEEVLNVTINDAWKTVPFYAAVVDARNIALGDQNRFLVEDESFLTVNKFSGNTWDTDREKLGVRAEISIPTNWFYARWYDDYERFLTGAISVESLANRLTQSFINHVDNMIAAAFNDAGTNLPAAFTFAGTLSTSDMKEIILKVKTASRKNVVIMGTELAISQLNDLGEVKYSDAMMNELYSAGRLGKWMGTTVIEVPQGFKHDSFDWSVENNTLLIVPESEKFIKFVDEGETRIRDLTQQDTHDQTIDSQTQRKMGCAAVFGSMFGKYTII